MKIDLDELERKARAATPGPWTSVTLALIARIRELEGELRLQCDRVDAFHESYTKVRRDPLGPGIRAILEKGVVIE